MTYDKLVQNVIPAGLLEDRQVAEVMLQPSGLRLGGIGREMLGSVWSRMWLIVSLEITTLGVTWAVARMIEIRNVSVQLVPHSQMMSQARASSSRMWPRWRQKNNGWARNRPSLSACARKVWKSWMTAACEKERKKQIGLRKKACCNIIWWGTAAELWVLRRSQLFNS